MQTISFITGSIEKYQEAKIVIPKLERINLDLPEIQEIDQKKILTAKLRAAADSGNVNIIVEDTGLYFQSLEYSLPGPLVKWFVKSIGNEGLTKLAQDGDGTSDAYALTTIAYLPSSSAEPLFFEGKLEGNIVFAKGTGFGWDAIFQPKGSTLTMGEMTASEKNEISHRGLAFRELAKFLG